MTDAYSGFSYPAWQHDAGCRPSVIPDVWQAWADSPLALFFPDVEDGRSLPSGWKDAISIVCGACPVRADCYDHALQSETQGYWAATSPNFRHLERRRLGIPEHVPERDYDQGGLVIGTFYPPAHGSGARYRKHLRHGDPPCEACIEGHRLEQEADHAERWQNRKRATTLEQRRAEGHHDARR